MFENRLKLYEYLLKYIQLSSVKDGMVSPFFIILQESCCIGKECTRVLQVMHVIMQFRKLIVCKSKWVATPGLLRDQLYYS